MWPSSAWSQHYNYNRPGFGTIVCDITWPDAEQNNLIDVNINSYGEILFWCTHNELMEKKQSHSLVPKERAIASSKTPRNGPGEGAKLQRYQWRRLTTVRTQASRNSNTYSPTYYEGCVQPHSNCMTRLKFEQGCKGVKSQPLHQKCRGIGSQGYGDRTWTFEQSQETPGGLQETLRGYVHDTSCNRCCKVVKSLLP